MIEIRAASVEDIAAVMSIMRAAFDPEFGEAWNALQVEGMLALPGTAMCIATKDGKVAGFALTRLTLDEVELLLIAVDPHARRCGIAKQLISFTMEIAVKLSAASIYLEVRKGNPACALYKSVGFIQIGNRPGYYKGIRGDVYDAETYQLILS